MTQAWARAIYEDDPSGPHVDGVRYSSAYNGGTALALWDSMGAVAVVTDSAGHEQDFALQAPQVRERLYVAMEERLIVVTVVEATGCPQCP